MGQKERLEQRFFELYDEIQSVLSELRRVNKEKGKNKTADTEYHQWLDNYLFADGIYDLGGNLNRVAGYFKVGVRRSIDLIECKDMVRVVKFDVDNWKPYIDYLNGQHFESSKDTYMECPECHSWVKKNCPVCICNHSFVDGEPMEVVYSSGMGYRKERFVKSGSILRHELVESRWVDGKLVEDDRAYIAEYRVVEGDEAKEISKSMSNPMVSDSFEHNMPTTAIPPTSMIALPHIYPARHSHLYQMSAAEFIKRNEKG